MSASEHKPCSSFVSLLFAWAKGQVPSLYIRSGPAACVVAAAFIALVSPSFSIPLLAWVALEIIWSIYFRLHLVPQLTQFRPEDSGSWHKAEEVDRVIDNIVFLLQQDRVAFWTRVTGHPCLSGSVPIKTAKCFVRSLLFMFSDCECYQHEEQVALYETALNKIEVATGGFLPSVETTNSEEADNTRAALPNLIRSWIDDAHLKSIIRCTPLIMVAISMLVRTGTFFAIWIAGWKMGHQCSSSRMECWVLNPPVPGSTGDATAIADAMSKQRPLVLLPGAGFGVTSFLPLVLLLQGQLAGRTMLLYRLPWVEVCHPWATLPQWSTIISGIMEGLHELGLGDATIDVISHSYGTAVANRLLRELCKPDHRMNNEFEGGNFGARYKFPLPSSRLFSYETQNSPPQSP